MTSFRDLIVIGGGFSGCLHAINLLRHDGPAVTLVERNPSVGGLAYGAADTGHLLNVRASNMSAFPDQPRHFVDWLERKGIAGGGTAFVPRTIYGAYLEELLAEARQRNGDRLTIVTGEATDLELLAKGVRVTMADGRMMSADAASLAMGNLPPHPPPGLNPMALRPGSYWPDPWERGVSEGLSADDIVLVIGTGLTMVDLVLLMEARGFKGRIVALSRRGLVPRPHAAVPPAERIQERPTTVASALVRAVRQRADEVEWRNAVDELRPFTQHLWRAASLDQKRRFLRHLRPWWDVHRHRLAPQVDDRLHAMIDSGQLDVVAGKLVAFDERREGIRVTWRPRASDELRDLDVSRIINCTGPEGALPETTEPLIRKLLARGTIRPDRCRIGIDVDVQGQTIRADGRSNKRLLALGPLTRGAFWEISAVPDIRAQVWDLARRLSNAHWVEGHGL